MKAKMLAISVALILATGAAWAQVKTEAGVGRISLIRGDVSTQRGDSQDRAAAALNAPIVSGDKISTGDSGRAEVQLDFANVLRLSERSEANVAALSQKDIQIQIGQGLATYSVFKNSEAAVELDTPNASVHPGAREGVYRILVTSPDETTVVVRKGETQVATPQGTTRVESGDMIIVRGSGDNTTYKVTDASNTDDWDRWNSDRDRVIRTAQSWEHTNRYYVGSEDLDAYGRWTTVPDYGQVWVPAVDPGWAPYRAGRWVWEPYWGWTWVSYDPWGWAPYHYGRWFMYGSAWAWWPGPAYGYPSYRPLWAPAYVSFFGFGGGFGVSVGFGWGSIGWLPIGPCDPYYPWWGGYRSHYNVVNITNITNIYNYRGGGLPPLRHGTQYSNLRLAANDEHFRSAISTVPAKDFGHGGVRPQPPTREAFNSGHLVTGNLPIVPTRESLNASSRPAAQSSLLARGNQPEHFFGRTPSTAGRESFDKEAAQIQSAIHQNGGFTPANGGQRTASQNRTPVGPATHDVRTGGTTNSPGQRQATNEDWRHIPGPRTSVQEQQGRDGSSTQATAAPRSSGSVNSPGQRQATNEEWRHIPSPRTVEPSRGNSPSSRGPVERPSSPTVNGGRDESWRRVAPSERPAYEAPAYRNPGGSYGGGYSAPTPGSTERSYGGWGQSAPRESRPPLQMGHPVVTPRYSAPSAPSGHGGGGRSGSPPSSGHHGR